MTVREFLLRLDHARRVKGGWQARCPAHDDRNPSLSISEGDGGKIVLYCHGGCETSAILSALGLTMADLFADSNPGEKRIAATYDYVDENGKLLFQVVRYDPKDFRQRRPDGKGDWIWHLDCEGNRNCKCKAKLPSVRRVLCNLPAVIQSDNPLVLEGEKDVETARKLGIVATCNPGGAGKWRPEYSEFLRGKKVTIISDADAPGVAHGHDVARSLLGVAASVTLIEALPGRDVKDLSDWFALYVAAFGNDHHQHPADPRECAKAALSDIIRETAELTAADVAKWTAPKATGFTLTPLGDLMSEPEEQTSWLLEGILPAGGLSLLAAKPKTGKSTLARCLGLAVARGEAFLGRAVQAGAVIYLALEEKRSEVRAHFRAMGASGEEKIFIHVASAPVDALPAIKVEVTRHNPVLIIIDPALRFVSVKDANDYAQVSAALETILTLARENGAHVLLVYHLGKGERTEAMDGILGSTAFFAAVDTALVMKRCVQYRTLESRQRYGDDLPEITLEFNLESRTLSLGVERAVAEAESMGRQILEFLQTAGEAKTEPEINEEVEGKNALKRKALRKAVEKGTVTREGTGKKGAPYKYSFPCTPPIPGTREQESQTGFDHKGDVETQYLFACTQSLSGTREQAFQNPAETRENTKQMLVPASEQKIMLVPAGKNTIPDRPEGAKNVAEGSLFTPPAEPKKDPGDDADEAVEV